MTTPNAGLYELTGDQRCITTVPMGEIVNVHYPNGRCGYSMYYGNTNTDAYAWSPIVPAKRKRWRARCGDKYFYISTLGMVLEENEDGGTFDRNTHSVGNYFRTEDEAKASPLYKAFQEMKG